MTEDKDAHRTAMARKKRIIEQRKARAQDERGVIVVNTGNGKGKSTAGFGMVARALGHGMRVGVVQFVKGAFSTGEESLFRQFDTVDYHVMGEGFTWETQDVDRDMAAARSAWAKAAAMLEDEAYGLVLLDELNIVLHKGYLPVKTVVAALERRPEMQHVVITGRHAPGELLEVADTVTWMKLEKHAFKAGVKAQKGVEL